MALKFTEIAFKSGVKREQELNGSRLSYARLEQGDVHEDCLSEHETGFISARDSFCLASVSETGWPW